VNHIYRCMDMIGPKDCVLDVGGASQPLRRADAVIDIVPYEKRSANTLFMNIPERFTRETWHVQDICDHRKPWPFKNKEFDFVVCGQTLEDIRDPLYVCEEMQRVGKRGFIECPSRFYEQMRGLEKGRVSGANHHRWIVCGRERALVFLMKTHAIHDPRYQLKPPLFSRYPHLNPNYESMVATWKGSFTAVEELRLNGEDIKFYEETRQLAKEIPHLWDTKAKTFGYPFPFGPADWRGIRRRTPESLEWERRWKERQ